jgi:hypothetical protein
MDGTCGTTARDKKCLKIFVQGGASCVRVCYFMALSGFRLCSI